MSQEDMNDYRPGSQHVGDVTQKPVEKRDMMMGPGGRGPGGMRGPDGMRGRDRDEEDEMEMRGMRGGREPEVNMDEKIPFNDGHVKVFCVPRKNVCASRLFCNLVNDFCAVGGVHSIIQAFSNQAASVTAVASMISLVYKASDSLHKDSFPTFGERFVEDALRRVLDTPDE